MQILIVKIKDLLCVKTNLFCESTVFGAFMMSFDRSEKNLSLTSGSLSG